MKSGKVKFFRADKGFGFIVPDEGGEEVYVQMQDLDGQILNKDEAVTYTIAHKQGRDRAVNVQRKGGFSYTNGYQPHYQPQHRPLARHQVMSGHGQWSNGNGYSPHSHSHSGSHPSPHHQQQQMVSYHSQLYDPQGISNGLACGTIKWFNEGKGFGFIVPADYSKDVYFKKADVQDGVALVEGEAVQYEQKTKDGKLWAVNIRGRQGEDEYMKAGRQQPMYDSYEHPATPLYYQAYGASPVGPAPGVGVQGGIPQHQSAPGYHPHSHQHFDNGYAPYGAHPSYPPGFAPQSAPGPAFYEVQY